MTKARGRPREVIDPVRVSALIAGAKYDRLDSLARRQGTSIPALLRAGADAILASENRQSSEVVDNQ